MIEACQEIADFDRAARWTAALTTWCAEQPGLVAVHRPVRRAPRADHAGARRLRRGARRVRPSRCSGTSRTRRQVRPASRWPSGATCCGSAATWPARRPLTSRRSRSATNRSPGWRCSGLPRAASRRPSRPSGGWSPSRRPRAPLAAAPSRGGGVARRRSPRRGRRPGRRARIHRGFVRLPVGAGARRPRRRTGRSRVRRPAAAMPLLRRARGRLGPARRAVREPRGAACSSAGYCAPSATTTPRVTELAAARRSFAELAPCRPSAKPPH